MNRSRLELALAIIVGLVGLISLVGAIVIGNVETYLRMTSALGGTLMLISAGLLLKSKQVCIVFLWLSAATYFLSIVVPGFAKHGIAAFGSFTAAFYWSLGTRVMFALFSHYIYRKPRNIS